MLIESMPESRSRAISRSTICAVCLRPVRASSRATNDCTPRLTRLIPALRQAATFSAARLPGAASIVASDQCRPGIAARIDARASGARLAGSSAAEINGLGYPGPIGSSATRRAARRGSEAPVRAETRPTRNCSTCTSARKKGTKCRRRPPRASLLLPVVGRSRRQPARPTSGRSRAARRCSERGSNPA